MAGQEISYFDAWSAWADGIDIRQRVLWGLEMYWWGRWGKIATFVAGFILVIDIIGPERIQKYLKSRERARVVKVAKMSERERVVHGSLSRTSNLRNLILGLALTLFVFLMFPLEDGLFSGPLHLVPTFLAFVMWVVFVLFKFDDHVLRAIVKLTRHNYILKTIRATSMLLLVVAFHFDFLAS